MSRSFTTFNHRLSRTPSPLMEIGSSLLGAVATVAAAAVVYQVNRHAQTPVSGLWWTLFGALAAIALGRVSDTFGRIVRTFTGRVPVVEVERRPWRPGERQRLRVANPNVRDLRSLDVTLEAADFLARVGGAATSPFTTLQHAENVFSAAGADLVTIDSGLDLVARVALPAHAEGKSWRWRIHVRCHPRRGPVRQHWFPLDVDATPVSQAKAG